jgi:O-acetyl-ADP-ribose deacetylase (regulator of RNase III)
MDKTTKQRIARLESAAQPLSEPGKAVVITSPDSDPVALVCHATGATYRRRDDETAAEFTERVAEAVTPVRGVVLLAEVSA